MSYITIKDIHSMSDEELRNIARRYLPSNRHFWIKRSELELMVAHMLSDNGELDPREADLINLPMFGDMYAVEGGDLLGTVLRLGIDMAL